MLFAALIERVVAWRRERVTLTELKRLNARDLADIGINGSEIRKIARAANYACSFDTEDFPDHPLYFGNPWFLPVVGSYYRLRDHLDRLLA